MKKTNLLYRDPKEGGDEAETTAENAADSPAAEGADAGSGEGGE